MEPHYHCATRSRADYSVQLPGSSVKSGELHRVCVSVTSLLRGSFLVNVLPSSVWQDIFEGLFAVPPGVRCTRFCYCVRVTPWLSMREEHELQV